MKMYERVLVEMVDVEGLQKVGSVPMPFQRFSQPLAMVVDSVRLRVAFGRCDQDF